MRFLELPVWNCDAVADSRRAQALALQERIEDFACIESGQFGGAFTHFEQSLLFSGRFERGQDPISRDQLSRRHHPVPIAFRPNAIVVPPLRVPGGRHGSAAA